METFISRSGDREKALVDIGDRWMDVDVACVATCSGLRKSWSIQALPGTH